MIHGHAIHVEEAEIVFLKDCVYISDIPQNTDPDECLQAAITLIEYAWQFKDVYPKKNLNQMKLAQEYIKLAKERRQKP